MICLLIYTYVSMPFLVMCLWHLGYEPQTFPSPLLHSYYILFESMYHFRFGHQSPIRHIFQPPSCLGQSAMNAILPLCSQPFFGHVLGLLPTILESLYVMVSISNDLLCIKDDKSVISIYQVELILSLKFTLSVSHKKLDLSL